jgi:hypothetical protein
LFASAYHVGAAEQNFVARVVDSGWTFWCKLVKLHWHKPPAYLVAPVQGDPQVQEIDMSCLKMTMEF